jgi:hypothetical protein
MEGGAIMAITDVRIKGGSSQELVYLQGSTERIVVGSGGKVELDILGDVTGDLTGDVIGDVTGDLTGEVIGNKTTLTKVATLNATLLVDNAETAIGYTIPAGYMVRNVFLDITTAEATATTKTISIGTDSSDSGVAAGYFNGASVAAASTLVANEAAVTAGATETYVSALGGSLLGDGIVGANSDGDFGLWQKKLDTASAGKAMTATFGDAGGANELVADVYVELVKLGA